MRQHFICLTRKPRFSPAGLFIETLHFVLYFMADTRQAALAGLAVFQLRFLAVAGETASPCFEKGTSATLSSRAPSPLTMPSISRAHERRSADSADMPSQYASHARD